MRRWSIAIALLATFASPASAATQADPVYATGCDEYEAFVAGDEAAIAARLPKGYTVERSPASGDALVYARAMRCSVGVMATYGIVVKTPDGRGCTSAAPVLGTVKPDFPNACNLHPLGWVASDARMVDWLRDGTPRFPARHVPNLVFEAGEQFRFRAPGFGMDATPQPMRPGTIAIRRAYWLALPQGTLRLGSSLDEFTAARATGTVTAPAGSELAALMGATEQPFLPGYDSFAAERWEHGVFRKQHLDGGGDTTSFAGSCSISGESTFDPPATNRKAQHLRYAFDGRGTCDGVRDGREVSDAPVRLRQAGEAYATCSENHTTQPGKGTLTFADGTTIRYTLDFTGHGTEFDGEMYGLRSGIAPGHGTFATPRTSPEVAAQCEGDGAARAPIDLKFETDVPRVDTRQTRERRSVGAIAPNERRSAPKSGKSGLRVQVTPRRARSGTRTRFVVRVNTEQGDPVVGAVVRLAGRAARTDRYGRARITARIHRRGARPLTASKRGHRAARASVAIR